METDLHNYYCSNKLAFSLFQSLEEVIGKNGLNTVLNLAGLGHLIDSYPEDNLEKNFNLAYISAINQALETLYGIRGGKSLFMRAGKRLFSSFLKDFGGFIGTGEMEFNTLPSEVRAQVGLHAMAEIFNYLTDQKCSVTSEDNQMRWVVENCAYCFGRSGLERTICYINVGMLQEALKTLNSVDEYSVHETKCIAKGDDVCEFIIQTPSE